ncbi:MAG: helix-turn-helix transcriptional regulator [Candidatus Aminicenantes bacterium]|nr:helix-turn-helix transcriptional regulator [Candidatus Aminicenantes bacterium]
MTNRKKNGKELCNRVVDYTLACPLENLKTLTVENIAKKFGISKMHLIKSFKIHRKITPGKFIVREKMLRAASLMQKDSNLIVKKIAGILGFSTSDYFIRVFKKHFGMPPRQYRDYKAGQDKEYPQTR